MTTYMGNPLSIKTKRILYFVFGVIFSRYMFFLDNWPIIPTILSILRFTFVPFIILLYLRKKPRWSIVESSMIIFAGVFLFCSFITGSSALIRLMSSILDIFIVWVLIRVLIKTHPIDLLEILIVIFSVAIYINFLLLFVLPDGFINPNGSMDYYLLGGNYNQFGKTMLPAVALHTFYTSKTNKHKLHLLFLVAVCIISLLIVGSKTSLLGITICFLFYVIRSYRLRKLGLFAFIIVYFLFQNFALKQSFYMLQNDKVTYFVEEVLHKDMTFSDRTTLWQNTILGVIQSPLVGHGLKTADEYRGEIGGVMPHNLLLKIVYEGGFMLLIAWIFMMIAVHIRYFKFRNKDNILLLVLLWVFLFMMIMEVYSYVMWMLPIIMIAHANEFDIETKSDTESDLKLESPHD